MTPIQKQNNSLFFHKTFSFEKGYRVLTWVHAKYNEATQREDFAAIIFPYFSKLGKQVFVGICWGKFSRVIDFCTDSAKVASFHLGEIQNLVFRKKINCSFSIHLCKPFKGYSTPSVGTHAVTAYTFFKPQNENLPYDDFLAECQGTAENSGLSIEAYWNNSMYPVLIITGGPSYHDVAKCALDLRTRFDWAVDSSSFFTLKINPGDYKPVADEQKDKFPVLISGKLASIADITKVDLRLENAKNLFEKPLLRYGWYDFCDALWFGSFFELYQYVLEMKKKYKGKVNFTSTVLLEEVAKK
jgi:hypothetical protein